MQESQDKDVREYAIEIINHIIQNGAIELKEGQQHPYHNQLSSDGTITKLIQQFKDKNKDIIHFYIAQTFAYLFKALPLPPDIKKDIIEKFKPDEIEELAFIAECPDNHDAILDGNYENNLFQKENKSFYYLLLTHNLLQFGSNANKKRVALAVKDKVEIFIIDEFLDEFIQEYSWIQRDQIKSKAKEALSLIKTVEELIEQEGEFEEINAQKIWNRQKDDEEEDDENDNEIDYDDEEDEEEQDNDNREEYDEEIEKEKDNQMKDKKEEEEEDDDDDINQ
ncbi:MAG: hypothetical protein EZS28_019044 [Streblomastix strix]|uniref:Uncharacterized protein n=1 Tax=Streblomastix strix TaxID=222440 RepID=A0A5J4VS70_9EUKA|nr:MAG: hypothetical protein EZS28_019044 [Streblomastix strix]